MPGAWLWLLAVSIALLLAFAIVFELTGPRWYNWVLLGLGLLLYFFAVVMYVFRGRKKRCGKAEPQEEEEDEEEDEYIPQAPAPASPAPATPVAKKPISRRPTAASRKKSDF